MPRRLCWKVGITWQLRLGRLGRFRFADAKEVWILSEALPTWDVGASGLMLHMGVEVVTMAPVSAIAVSEMAKLGGAGLQLGISVKF